MMLGWMVGSPPGKLQKSRWRKRSSDCLIVTVQCTRTVAPRRPSNRELQPREHLPSLVAIAILSSVGAADSADAMTYKDIAGQWCSDVTDYVFTPDTLTVKFHDSRPANVFKITKYTYTNNSVRIDWLNDAGKESVTVFAEFVGQRYHHGAAAERRQTTQTFPPLLRLSGFRMELFFSQ
jgi:hypothetical protein